MDNIKKKILVLDDETEICNMIQEHMDLFDIEALCFQNGEDALAFLRKMGPHHFHAILSDIRMFPLSGVDFCRIVMEERLIFSPFFFMTGFADISNETLLELGAKRVFLKPFSIKCLLDEFDQNNIISKEALGS